MNKRAKTGGEACVQLANGTYSDAVIHEEIMAGVDDSDIRARTRARLLESGIPPSSLNGAFPDLDPLPIDLTEERERIHRAKIRAELHGEYGVSVEKLNQMFPELPPLPED